MRSKGGRWSWALIERWIILCFGHSSTVAFGTFVFVTLLCTALKTAISEVQKLLHIVVLAVADSLFSLCKSERTDKLFMSSPSPLSLISLMVSVDVKLCLIMLHLFLCESGESVHCPAIKLVVCNKPSKKLAVIK